MPTLSPEGQGQSMCDGARNLRTKRKVMLVASLGELAPLLASVLIFVSVIRVSAQMWEHLRAIPAYLIYSFNKDMLSSFKPNSEARKHNRKLSL